jgi:hypothetical protein
LADRSLTIKFKTLLAMKKIFFAIVMFSLGIVSVQAQYGPRPNHNSGYNDRYDRNNRDINRNVFVLKKQAREQIAEGIRRGSLNSREANSLMKQYDKIDHRAAKLTDRRGRISERDARALRDDLHRLMADTRRLTDHHSDRWANGRNQRY